jgi:hypothetical protein
MLSLGHHSLLVFLLFQTLELTDNLIAVASLMIVKLFYEQMRMRSVPIFHRPHWVLLLSADWGI